MNFYAFDTESVHQPVMVREVIHYLSPVPGGTYMDCTFGAGGHTQALLEAMEERGEVIALELDPDLVKKARELLKGKKSVRLVEGNYRDALSVVRGEGKKGVNGVILDLGFSSYHVGASGRGFSFRHDEPLDMRYSPGTSDITAKDVVNSFSEEAISRILREFGEEKDAKRIARAVVRVRKKTPIRTSGELAAVVRSVIREGAGRRRIDPATRTFQALRIFVNRELENLEEFLTNLPHLLIPGGRAVIISYHSLEDRLVKTYFKKYSGKCVCPPGTPLCACGKEEVFEVLTPKPVVPSRDEVVVNPRARSAKLRAVAKRGSGG